MNSEPTWRKDYAYLTGIALKMIDQIGGIDPECIRADPASNDLRAYPREIFETYGQCVFDQADKFPPEKLVRIAAADPGMRGAMESCTYSYWHLGHADVFSIGLLGEGVIRQLAVQALVARMASIVRSRDPRYQALCKRVMEARREAEQT